jgi:hypothetical protein
MNGLMSEKETARKSPILLFSRSVLKIPVSVKNRELFLDLVKED